VTQMNDVQATGSASATPSAATTAATPSATTATTATSNGVMSDSGEHYNGGTLVVTAYAAIWLIIMGFLLSMWRKQSALNERLDGLERAIDRAAAAADRKADKAS